MNKHFLLVDADIIAYKAAVNAEFEVAFNQKEYENGLYWLMTNKHEAICKAHARIESLKTKFKTDEVLLCFSHKQNWRKQVLHEYKAKRAHIRRPMRLKAIRHRLAQDYPTKVVPQLEADDVMGILATMPKFKPNHQKIIVTEDKDLRCIPGWLFNPVKHREPKLISEDEADLWHMLQTLTGDSTDEYSGCPGIGISRAEKYLREKLKPLNTNTLSHEGSGKVKLKQGRKMNQKIVYGKLLKPFTRFPSYQKTMDLFKQESLGYYELLIIT